MGEGSVRAPRWERRMEVGTTEPGRGSPCPGGRDSEQQLSLPVAPCCQPSGDPRGRWFQSLTEKDKWPTLRSGEGQKGHRAHGGLLTAND